MRIAVILASLSLLLSACSSGGGSGGAVVIPQASGPIADLATGTEMPVRGNHTGWWTTNFNCTANPDNCPNEAAPNTNGPKLQRLDVHSNQNWYIAVFRNNWVEPAKDYGKAEFLMPEPGGFVTGTTTAGYKYTIINNKIDGEEQLTYVLAGLFKIANNPIEFPSRFAYGGYVAGSQTPTSDLPTTGVVTYNGTFIGQSSIAGAVTGIISLEAFFESTIEEVVGTISAIRDGETNVISDLSFIAEIDENNTGIGQYAGIVTVTLIPDPVLEADFSPGSTGVVDGGFYGPGGIETGGTIRVVDGTNALTGAFGAVRTGTAD